MNQIKIISLLILLSSALIYFSSCKDDDCDGTLDCAGICNGSAQEDCEGTCNGDKTIGTPCDDGDPNTENDVYNASCECVGGEVDLCADVDATYNGDVLSIIEMTCGYQPCHTGYLTYDSLKIKIDEGKFEAKVLDPNAELPMPPAFVPEDKPASLTDEQLFILNCWKDAGYPQN